MKKILIIGQAPPYKKQVVPYDTTMLYDILLWVYINKQTAQRMFIFDALIDFFPGFTAKSQHKIPTKEQFEDYLDRGLRGRILEAEKILVLGKIPFLYLTEKQNELELASKHVLSLMHPSMRNYKRIMAQRQKYTQLLTNFIKAE